MPENLFLIEELKKNAELTNFLSSIKDFSENIWKNKYLPWFTNHNTLHSEEIIYLLGQILLPLKGTPHFLNDYEIFILLSAAYLHDIGMQNLIVSNKTIETLTYKDYCEVRKLHCQKSYAMIVSRFTDQKRDSLQFPPNVDEEFIPSIALVSKAHGGDYFKEVINYIEKNPETPRGRKIRCQLLAALLMIGDELDLQGKRVQFQDLRLYKPSDYSLMHWYKHHYVDYVEIEKGQITIQLRFPNNSNNYKLFIQNEIKTKIEKQISNVNPILRSNTNGLLSLHNLTFISVHDQSGIKRELPRNVFELFRGKHEKVKTIDEKLNEKNIEILHKKDQSTMVLIPEGDFTYGSNEDDIYTNNNEIPQQQIYLPQFYIDIYAVTNEQYCTFLNEAESLNDSLIKSYIDLKGNETFISDIKSKIIKQKDEYFVELGYENFPVTWVSWYGASAYAKWAGKRLPTEVEWEKSARGTKGYIYPWGNFKMDQSYKKNEIFPVDAFPDRKSPYGCQNMVGNIKEWCEDFYNENNLKNNSTIHRNEGLHSLRGGSWSVKPDYYRVAYRSYEKPIHRNFNIGFRLVKD